MSMGALKILYLFFYSKQALGGSSFAHETKMMSTVPAMLYSVLVIFPFVLTFLVPIHIFHLTC